MLMWILLGTLASALFIIGLCLFYNNVLYGPKETAGSAGRVRRQREEWPARS
jgi:hypothetical protein